ncbi:MAG: FAD-dependent oxidoreductase [Ignavibacteriae bacterium]|nr:FAD-dependent oxidoreductase [Ignavibacteriota bacterium]
MKKKVVVIGAGITGLFTAYKLSQTGKHEITVVEKEEYIGGISSTFKHNGYQLDFGPHKIYTQIDGVLNEIVKLLGDELIAIPKKSSIRLMGKFFNYPISIKELILSLSPITGFKIGLGYIKSVFIRTFAKPADDTYEQWLINRFGVHLYNIVFRPYAEKIWGEPDKLDAKLAKSRVAIPNLIELLKGLIFNKSNNPSMNAEKFYYPKNGIISLSSAMRIAIEGKGGRILTLLSVDKIQIQQERVKYVEITNKGEKVRLDTDFLVSTIPINELVNRLSPVVPADVKKASDSIGFRSLILLYLVVGKDRILNDNWIFFPEKKFIFNRISEQKGFSPTMAPEGESILCTEITCNLNDEKWNSSDEELYKHVIAGLEEAGLVYSHGVKKFFSRRIVNAYPLYKVGFSEHISRILSYIDGIENLITNGRQGMFNYNNMDHCIEMGRVCAEHIISNRHKSEHWNVESKKFDNFKIVD